MDFVCGCCGDGGDGCAVCMSSGLGLRVDGGEFFKEGGCSIDGIVEAVEGVAVLEGGSGTR